MEMGFRTHTHVELISYKKNGEDADKTRNNGYDKSKPVRDMGISKQQGKICFKILFII